MELPKLNYKKIALVILFFVVAIGLLWLVYRLFFYSPPEEPVGPGSGVTPPGQLPPVGPGSGGITGSQNPGRLTELEQAQQDRVSDVAQGDETRVLPVSADRVLDPTPTRDGRDVAYYDSSDGKFYRLSADGENKTLLTDERFFSVEGVTWSDDKNQALIEYPDGSNILYDFTVRQSVTLPQGLENPSFAPSSGEIAFKLKDTDPENNWLVITDPAGGDVRFVEPIREQADLVQVLFSPHEEVVAFYHSPISSNQEEIFPIGQAGENFRSFIVDGLNFKGKYSPDSNRILYHITSSSNDFNPSLWVVDGNGSRIGDNKFDLGLSTWIDKCVFSGNSRIVYCAVPQTLSSGSGFSESSIGLTRDNFYRIDLDTGLKRLIAVPVVSSGEESVAVTSMWLDSSESNLFFWDGRTEKVFKMRVK